MSLKTTYFKLHLNELKLSFFVYVFTFLLLFSINFYYIDQIIFLLIKPIIKIQNLNHFILSTVTEAFTIKISISFYVTFFLLLPCIFLYLWYILSDGFYKNENKTVLIFFFYFIVIYFLGFILIYLYIIPNIWNFFQFYEKTNNIFLFNIFLEPKLDKYIFITLNFLIYTNIFFQYPILLLMFIKKFLSYKFLIQNRKIFYTKFLIIATILSPPDIFSQVFLTIPTIIIFESYIFLKIFLKKYKQKNLID